jgi:ribosomal protein S21
MIIQSEVKLDKNKSLEKPYFDRMYKKFARDVQTSLIFEELRFRRYAHSPSKLKKLKKEFNRLKWREYR